MLHARQSVAADSTDTFEEDGGFKTDIMTQVPVWDAAAAVRASLSRRKYASGSFSTDSAAADAAPAVTGHSQAADRYTLVLDLPPRPRRMPSATLHALQEWEGYVLHVGEEEFEARLIDLTAGAVYEGEEATIPRQELSDHDAKKLRVGAIFRWVIGYERTAGGSRRRVSQIVFRDLPAVTKTDLRDGEAWAGNMFQSLNP